MTDNRFDNLEGGKPLSPETRKALEPLSRFDHLEIGALKPAPSPAAAARGKILCLHCGQPNEAERESCWACFGLIKAKPKTSPKGPEDITLVLNGTTYHSSDPDLPEDIRDLMTRIRREGYRPELLADWQARRDRPEEAPEKPSEPETRGEDPQRDIKVFKGQRVSVIRVDGHVYTSDDPGLSEEMRELFRYVDENGVTPALMEHLRRFSKDVEFRPATTGEPTTEDLAFWKEVSSQPSVETLGRQEEALAPAQGRSPDHKIWFRLAAVALGGLLLYMALGLLRG